MSDITIAHGIVTPREAKIIVLALVALGIVFIGLMSSSPDWMR